MTHLQNTKEKQSHSFLSKRIIMLGKAINEKAMRKLMNNKGRQSHSFPIHGGLNCLNQHVRSWCSGQHCCLPSSRHGFDSRRTHNYFFQKY